MTYSMAVTDTREMRDCSDGRTQIHCPEKGGDIVSAGRCVAAGDACYCDARPRAVEALAFALRVSQPARDGRYRKSGAQLRKERRIADELAGVRPRCRTPRCGRQSAEGRERCSACLSRPARDHHERSAEGRQRRPRAFDLTPQTAAGLGRCACGRLSARPVCSACEEAT